MSLLGEHQIFGDAKARDSRAMGFWTHGGTHGRHFEKRVLRTTLSEATSTRKGGSRAPRATPAFAHSLSSLCVLVTPRSGDRGENDKRGKKQFTTVARGFFDISSSKAANKMKARRQAEGDFSHSHFSPLLRTYFQTV